MASFDQRNPIVDFLRACVGWAHYALREKPASVWATRRRRVAFRRMQPPLVRMVDFEGAKFAVHVPGHGYIEDHILLHGHWSGDLLRLADPFVRPGTVVIEVGANIGFESLYFAARHPDCRVHAYEPSSYGHEALCRSKAINRLDNLSVHRLAAGAGFATLPLSVPSERSVNKGLGSLRTNADIDDTYGSETVEIVPLDSRHGPADGRVSLLKIDTQGYEWEVLQGAVGLIGRDRPVIVFEHEDRYHERPQEVRRRLAEFFEKAGYGLYAPGEAVLRPVDFGGVTAWQEDVFALPRSVHQR